MVVVVLLPVCVAGVLGFADYRWRATTARMVTRMRHDGVGSQRPPFSAAELTGLPAPTTRYFRSVLRDSQPVVRRARFLQRGEFLLRPARNAWRPFSATQHVATEPPGFVWDARIRMVPGLNVSVRDSFVQGTGSMLGSVLGLFRVVSVEPTPELAAGELHRYLAEAVWFPTALLPRHGVVWMSLDDSSARATLTVAGTTVSLDFRFDTNNLVQSIFTPERARDVGGRVVLTPWQGRFSDYTERDGMRSPLAGEVEWLLPEGPQVYWRGRITEIVYEYAQPQRTRLSCSEPSTEE